MKRIFETFGSKWPEYLIEMVVITAGILGAYTLNGWKEFREDRQEEKGYLQEVNKEFKENRDHFQKVIEQNKKALKSCIGILSEYEKTDPNPDSLISYDSSAWITRTFDPSQSSIHSLINSSSLRLIRNDELRKLLVSWNDLARDYQEEEILARNYFWDQLMPYMTRHFDFQAIRKGNYTRPPIELEFQNMVMVRIDLFNLILFGGEHEMEKVRVTMDRIIELSETAE